MSTWANEPSHREAFDALQAALEATRTMERTSASLADAAERLQRLIEEGRSRDEILAALAEMHALADLELTESSAPAPVAASSTVDAVSVDEVMVALEELDRRLAERSDVERVAAERPVDEPAVPAEPVLDLDALLAAEFDPEELMVAADSAVPEPAAPQQPEIDVDALLAAEFDYLAELYPPALEEEPVEEVVAEGEAVEAVEPEPLEEVAVMTEEPVVFEAPAEDDFAAALAAALAEPAAPAEDLVNLAEAPELSALEESGELVHSGANEAELMAFLKGFEPVVAQPEAEAEEEAEPVSAAFADSLEELDLGPATPRADAGNLLGEDYSAQLRVPAVAAPPVEDEAVEEESETAAKVDPLYVPAELREDFFARAPKAKAKTKRFGRK
ncbi:MAG TPA: hypothetical protein VFA11_11200 [Acidimicrobiales bacterium]|nr:hypothetical protein [Acidimicrobiales bacterium]